MCKMKYVWALAVNFRRLLLAIDHLVFFVGGGKSQVIPLDASYRFGAQLQLRNAVSK